MGASSNDHANEQGAGFLFQEIAPANFFTPEDFKEESLALVAAAQDFFDQRVSPAIPSLERKETDTAARLLEQAGEQGLLGLSIPETYGGLGIDLCTSLRITEVLSAQSAFSTAYGAHTGIGTLPILYFGNEDQKNRYLPDLVSGKRKACYCLTEPNAGSNAQAGSTRATIQDGNYALNGQKIWISNAGFADVFVVFAKIEDSQKLSAFIVERTYPGLSFGEEEHKLGLHGSSTRQVFFQNCIVPNENLLGEVDRGFIIALSILNAGRIKLAAGCVGATKHIIALAAEHVLGRKQFGQPLATYGAVAQKIARITANTFACEAAVYRAAHAINAHIQTEQQTGTPYEEASKSSLKTFALECALLKVAGTELLGYAADEGVQLYGGMGYSEEAPMARIYRDARITRIYEGTNEINRLLLVDQLIKKALQKEIPLWARAREIGDALTTPRTPESTQTTALSSSLAQVHAWKQVAIVLVSKAAQVFDKQLAQQQTTLLLAADIIIATYLAESACVRAARLQAQTHRYADVAAVAAQLYVQVQHGQVGAYAEQLVSNLALVKEEQRIFQAGLRRLLKRELHSVWALEEQLSAATFHAKKYYFH